LENQSTTRNTKNKISTARTQHYSPSVFTLLSPHKTSTKRKPQYNIPTGTQTDSSKYCIIARDFTKRKKNPFESAAASKHKAQEIGESMARFL
jgi:hypothetical protein